MPMTGFGSQCVSRCTSVYTKWRLYTCRHSANPCQAFLVVVICAWLVVANWTFHVLMWLRTGDGRLPTPVPHLGTLYLQWQSQLCKPLNAISRSSYFPYTSTFQSVWGFFLQKCATYKSTVIIIVITIIIIILTWVCIRCICWQWTRVPCDYISWHCEDKNCLIDFTP